MTTAPPASPAAPALGPPRWYSHPFNRASLYCLAAAMSWLPRRGRLEVARRLGRLAARFVPNELAAVRKALALVTGATGSRLDELAREVFAEFAMCFSDLLTTNRRPAPRLMAQLCTVRGAEVLRDLDGGMISLTAHVGNWEMAGRLLAGRAARPTHVVVADEPVPALERWVRRDGDGVRFVTRQRPTVSIELVAALRRGEVVALQGDRALGTRGDVIVPFFGRPAPFPSGPFVLARAAGVPLVPAFCVLGSDRRYVMTVLPPLTIAAGGEEDGVRAWVARLEEIVRERPTQWFNFFDVWDPFGFEPGARST